MAVSTYIADGSNKVRGLSYAYSKTGQHIVQASNNVSYAQFVSGSTDSNQAKLYTSISFGSNVISIPSKCCFNFINLKVVSFAGQNVTFIGDEAFSGCKQLYSIDIPRKVSTIGSNAFSGCASLASVKFPSSAINIGSKAFCSTALTSVNAAFGESSGEEIFAECTSLNTATVDGRLCAGMFKDCLSLKNVLVKCQTSIIPKACFKGCSSLGAVQFANLKLVEYIDDDAFSGCTSLNSFSFEDTIAKQIGKNILASTAVQSVTLPSTITSPSQLNSQFLGGSIVNYVKFTGINSAYMNENPAEFSAFGGNSNSMTIESSDGKKYKIDTSGLVVDQPIIVPAEIPVYIISVAISNNLTSAPLEGMYKDSQRFINLVNEAYADNPELIIGVTRLNDDGTPQSNGLGTAANIDQAFETAKNAGARYVMFHFSDHGERKSNTGDGFMYLYNNEKYTYEKLYSKLYDFEYAFVILCCCYPNSTNAEFTPGSNNTKALFWCAGQPGESTLMQPQVGHKFITKLVKKFNSNYTWKEQWDAIKSKYSEAQTLPSQYIYGEFPVDDKVFRVM